MPPDRGVATYCRARSSSTLQHVRTSRRETRKSESVYVYIVEKKHAEGTTKAEKRRRPIREKAQSFVVDDGVLLHRNHAKILSLCRVVVDDAQKTRIFSSLDAGAHYGQNATIKQVTDRFWCRRNVTSDARDLVRACTVCQKCIQPTNRHLQRSIPSPCERFSRDGESTRWVR